MREETERYRLQTQALDEQLKRTQLDSERNALILKRIQLDNQARELALRQNQFETFVADSVAPTTQMAAEPSPTPTPAVNDLSQTGDRVNSNAAANPHHHDNLSLQDMKTALAKFWTY